MFRISEAEKEQLVINCDRFKPLKHSSSLPYVFTEHGALMIVEAFVRLREVISTHSELVKKKNDLEKRVDYHDETLIEIIQSCKKHLPVYSDKPKIGFK